MNDQNTLSEKLNQDFSLCISGNISMADLREKLAARIHDLINNNFQELIRLLYKIDIDENRLKYLLAKKDEDAGMLIADLIIERQLQKIDSRKKYRNTDRNSDEEKW